jgi:nitrate/TMAO reductase-like tetraheme cytochrome c subunit
VNRLSGFIHSLYLNENSRALRPLTMLFSTRDHASLVRCTRHSQQRVLDGLANMWRWNPEQGVVAKDQLCKIQSAIDQTDTQLRAMAECAVQANTVATTTPMATASTNTCTNCHNATAAA